MNPKKWPWLRIAAAAGSAALGVLAAAVPAVAVVAVPAAAYLAGVATKTPGHVPAPPQR